MRRCVSAMLSLAVAASGCSRGETTAGTTVRSDSAGVHIVENFGPDQLTTPSATLEYRLGGAPSGPESFYEVRPWQVGISESGIIGVVNRQAYQAVTFNSDGKFLATFGRQGGGPGEFRFPSSIAVEPSGGVTVYDYQKRAMVRFSADGTVREEARPTVPFSGVRMVSTPSGLILMSEARPRGDGTAVSRLLWLSPTDTVQLGPSTHRTTRSVTYLSCGMSLSQPPLFSSNLVWGSNGARTAVVAGPGYSIWVFDDTTLVSIVRRDMEPEAVTEAVAAREVGEGERWTVGATGPECLVPAAEVLEQRGYAPHLPLVDAIAVTPSGWLWVKRRTPGTQVLSVDVFDETGRYVATLSPPPPFPVALLPDGRIVAVEKDSLDIETLAVYSIGFGGR